jgi:hypothetical protein
VKALPGVLPDAQALPEEALPAQHPSDGRPWDLPAAAGSGASDGVRPDATEALLPEVHPDHLDEAAGRSAALEPGARQKDVHPDPRRWPLAAAQDAAGVVLEPCKPDGARSGA